MHISKVATQNYWTTWSKWTITITMSWGEK